MNAPRALWGSGLSSWGHTILGACAANAGGLGLWATALFVAYQVLEVQYLQPGNWGVDIAEYMTGYGIGKAL